MGTSEFNIIFSNNLRRLLEENGMTQLELAKRVGVGTTSVSNWCKGIKVPRMDKVDAMCKIFSCRRSDLMEERTTVPTDGQPEWYSNPETARMAQAAFERSDLRILMDASADLPPESVLALAEIAKRMKGTNPDG